MLRTVQHYSILDELSATYGNGNQHLSACLPYITFKESVGSLAANEDFDLMQYSEFLSMVKLVEQQYGPEKITPNMHLCLHICECALDYGPLYSFWCYSFERMNGLLGNINININII